MNISQGMMDGDSLRHYGNVCLKDVKLTEYWGRVKCTRQSALSTCVGMPNSSAIAGSCLYLSAI